MQDNQNLKKYLIRPSKECAYIAVYVALLLGVQFAFSFIPGVEFVTLLLVCYAFVFGSVRGMVCATAFSLLRCFIFGFFPDVIILYLVYYNLLTLGFGLLKNLTMPKFLFLIIIVATFFTICFTLLSDIITPLTYGYSKRATKAFFIASLSFMIPQSICTTISVSILFLPLTKALNLAKRGLLN